jgi:hypothetical protein
MRVTESTVRADDGFAVLLTDEDEEFLARFEACTLPEIEWTHLAHIRVAWTCLNLGLAETALERIRQGILEYNTRVLGRRHKYHETVTVAFVQIVAGQMRKGESWDEFKIRIDDLLDPESPILLRFYSSERLFSSEARESFVEPDLRNLPSFTRSG